MRFIAFEVRMADNFIFKKLSAKPLPPPTYAHLFFPSADCRAQQAKGWGSRLQIPNMISQVNIIGIIGLLYGSIRYKDIRFTLR
jgi:hypothetical protein